MLDKKKAEKELQKDALYFNLINKRYSPQKAEFIVKRYFNDKENIIWFMKSEKRLNNEGNWLGVLILKKIRLHHSYYLLLTCQ